MVKLTLRDGLVPQEFIDVGCKEVPTSAEADRARQLKEEMAERLLSLDPPIDPLPRPPWRTRALRTIRGSTSPVDGADQDA